MSAGAIGAANAAAMPLRGLRNVVSRSGLVLIAACLAIALFALVPASTRIAGFQVDGVSIGLIRAVGAGLLTAPLLLICRLRPPSNVKDLSLLLLYALGNFAAFPVLFSLGTQRTSGEHAALIMATMPVFIGLIGIVLDRRLPRFTWFIGIAIALTGEAALVGLGQSGNAAGATTAGDAIVFAACALSAVGLVAGARLGTRMNPLAAAFWAMTIAAVGLAPFAAVHALSAPYRYLHLTWTTWGAIIQITVGAAVLANICLVWALSKGGLVRIAPLQLAQPVCAMFFASALLNEPLTPSLLLVAAAIVFGVVIASRAARLRSAPEEPARTIAERLRATARFLAPLFLEPEQERKALESALASPYSAAAPLIGGTELAEAL